MHSNSVRLTIFFLLVSSSLILAACSTPAEPSATQLPMQTNTQPVLPTDTQPPLITTDTLPPLPTDTQPPVSTDTQLPPPTITQPQSTSTEAQPTISGATLLDTRCTVCHSKAKVTGKHKSQSEWDQTIQRMVLKGAFLTPEELMILVEYLAQNY